MKHSRTRRGLAGLLVCCLLVVSGLAAAQSITHESHHAHHNKATHSTVLCSLMCAAGQVLGSSPTPDQVERSPIIVATGITFSFVPHVVLDSATSRGPPAFSSI